MYVRSKFAHSTEPTCHCLPVFVFKADYFSLGSLIEFLLKRTSLLQSQLLLVALRLRVGPCQFYLIMLILVLVLFSNDNLDTIFQKFLKLFCVFRLHSISTCVNLICCLAPWIRHVAGWPLFRLLESDPFLCNTFMRHTM